VYMSRDVLASQNRSSCLLIRESDVKQGPCASVSITVGIELPLPGSSLRKIAEYDGAMDAIVCVWMIYVLLEWSRESGGARGASRQWSYAYVCANMSMCECVCMRVMQ